MVITQEGNLVRNKMGHCDNPRGGIYNPYQIEKEPFAYLAFWAAFYITRWVFFHHVTKQCA